ncbi:hypothetical protein BDN71DRAFT_1436387 [Pleurotus eryngii]|uniref:Uncharacterized protein n=1 Tax=Pleurotus eryngii TaxID=5323 RepID=A0A9P5ZIY1_PLEER|nr:hypothetical protein BDN71DRAFT_1436387 [Pleurotus eryngii]
MSSSNSSTCSPGKFNELISILLKMSLSPTKARALSAMLNMLADAMEEDNQGPKNSTPPLAETPANSPILFQFQQTSSLYSNTSSEETIASFSPTALIESNINNVNNPSDSNSGYWSLASLPPSSLPLPLPPPLRSPPSSLSASSKEKLKRWAAAWDAMKQQRTNEINPIVLHSAILLAPSLPAYSNKHGSHTKLPAFGMASSAPSDSISSTCLASPEGAYYCVFQLSNWRPLTFYVAPPFPKGPLYVITHGREIGIFCGWPHVLPLISRVQTVSHCKISSIEQGEQIMWDEYVRGTCMVI